MKLKIIRDYYDGGDFIYQYSSLTLHPGVTMLVGCNGSGKSTLLQIISDYCIRNTIKCAEYSDTRNGRSNAMNKMLWLGDFQGLASNFIASEGESIYNNIGNFAKTLRDLIINHKKVVLLFDGVDSGQSIDGLIDIKDLFSCIVDDATSHGCECYLICTANSYELADGFRCIDVTTGKRRKFSSYKAYKKFVLASSEYKHDRYAKLDADK